MHLRESAWFTGFCALGICLIVEIIYFSVFYRNDWDNSGTSSLSDLWLIQHAHITPKSIEKLQDNVCNIPILNPYSPPMARYFHTRDINCKEYKQFYFTSHISESGTPSILTTKPLLDELTCCYELLRFRDTSNYNPYTLETDRCTFIMKNGTKVPLESQYIIINCWNHTDLFGVVSTSGGGVNMQQFNKTAGHRELLFFIPKPSPVLVEEKKRILPNQEKLNVIIMGFDQISRLNFIRLMGKTFDYLRNELGAIDLQGYNKIGDATLNNTMAFLTGFDYGGLQKICWKNESYTFDACPWIWKNFSEKGYITAYSDDYDSVFNYRFKGFQRQPTDYYMQPFAQWFVTGKDKPLKIFGSSYCIGNEKLVDILQDHIRKVSGALRDVPYFHFTWQSRIHEVPEYPSAADEGTVSTLKHLQANGILNKSVVIMLSDHGWRAGPIMRHLQARLENRMPFAFILLPKWFQSKYHKAYANIVDNQYRLTTPYDIYSTMLDILSSESQLAEASLEQRSFVGEPEGKSVSLFLPFPKNRTCQMAKIDELWCVCSAYKSFHPESPLATELGKFAVETLNSWLRPFKDCAQYRLDKVISAASEQEQPFDYDNIDQKGNQTFRISFLAKPKQAEFEVVIFSENRGGSGGEPVLRMSTEVFRLNWYGASNCISVYMLKKICTCKPDPKL